jgi:ABC-type thiamine transport system substrate-binding protein
VRARLIAVAGVLAVAVAIAAALVATRSDGEAVAKDPTADPRAFAVGVVRLIVQNKYGEAWGALHPVDRRVASRAEYVGCENRSRFTARFVRARVAHIADEAVGLGNGRFVRSKAVDVLITLEEDGVAPFVVRHTMHVVPSGSKWTWILPSWRYVDFRANRCPTAPHAPSPPS